jgi:hypothetical protein
MSNAIIIPAPTQDGALLASVRGSAGLSGGLAFDGLTTGQRASANTGGGANRILTGDVTYWVRFRVGVKVQAQVLFAHTVSEAFLGTQNIYLDVTSGNLRAVIAGSLGTPIATVTGFWAAYSGQVVDVHVRRSGTTLTVFVNGAQAATTTAAGVANSLDGEFLKLGAQSSTAAAVDAIFHRAAYWNRALTDAQILSCITDGVAFADQWASQTAQTSGLLVVGKRYRINTYVAGDDFTAVGAASNASGVEFVATATTATWANASSLVRIGALAAFDFEVGVGFQLHDRSTNNFHAALVGSPAPYWTMPKRSGVLYASGSFSSGVATRLLLADALPSGALIEEVVVNVVTGTPTTVSLGTLSTATTDIVNAQTVAAGRNVETMASRFQASGTAQLWATFNAAATATFSIPYTLTQ